MKKYKIGGQFSGVGAFDQALIRLGIDFENVYQADWDKYARETYLHNYEAPEYYIKDVYDTPVQEITDRHGSLDIMMFSPPCQAFSLAGKRKGEKDKRGVLFYNSHEFIVKNKPRYFIFENVKGLLSDDSGKTFNRWLDYLGGKSVNGNPVIFPLEDATPYHIYHKVLNAKNYGVPQNRERVFIVGIRDDSDNIFTWPKKQHLTKRLKDVLENDVDEKYYLSDLNINKLINSNFNQEKSRLQEKDISDCLLSRDCKDPKCIKVKSATKKGFKIANKGDSINLSQPNSETRRGRVGKEVVQTLDTSCSQAVIINKAEIQVIGNLKGDKGHNVQNYYSIEGISPTVMENHGNVTKVMMGAIRGRNPENPLSREVGLPTEQRLELNLNETSNALTTVQKDNVVVYDLTNDFGEDKTREYTEAAPSLRSSRNGLATNYNSKIRRLTPRECMRLMDFNPDMIEKTLNSKQNLYFQFIYSKFNINKKETLWNAKLKTVKEPLIQENLETFVYCTTKELQKLELLTNAQKERIEKPQSVNFVIEKLAKLEQKECVINITKWTDFTETLYTSKKDKTNPAVVVILETQKEGEYTEELWKITLEENLPIEKLYIILILLRQIMTLGIYTYAKTEVNTQRFIAATINYEKESGRLLLSSLKMEYTKQIISNSMLYKQAGNSIVVAVLAGVISKLNL
jgi:DNA (cytosine-5)-methyltransferase 1